VPAKLTSTVSKMAQGPKKTNSTIIEEFYSYMKAKGPSEQHQINLLNTVIAYENFLGLINQVSRRPAKNPDYGIPGNKVKPSEQDPERKWITTYSHYFTTNSICFPEVARPFSEFPAHVASMLYDPAADILGALSPLT
jgi:hypothetical protein